jgi:hypothetical protein
MRNLALKFLVGSAGATGVEVAQHIEIPATTEVKDIVSILIQIAIGVATLIGMFKKKKNNIEPFSKV